MKLCICGNVMLLVHLLLIKTTVVVNAFCMAQLSTISNRKTQLPFVVTIRHFSPCSPSVTIPSLFNSQNDNDQDNVDDGSMKPATTTTTMTTTTTTTTRTKLTPQQLGFDSPVRATSQRQQQPDVRVDLIKDIDSVTLTAVGFGLIALNFLVFANMGDGGIGGVVATIINTWDN